MWAFAVFLLFQRNKIIFDLYAKKCIDDQKGLCAKVFIYFIKYSVQLYYFPDFPDRIGTCWRSVGTSSDNLPASGTGGTPSVVDINNRMWDDSCNSGGVFS